MVSGGAGSDESVFFTDPDTPEEVDGAGPPGPLVGGDQVRNSGVVSGCSRLSGGLRPAAIALGMDVSLSTGVAEVQRQKPRQRSKR